VFSQPRQFGTHAQLRGYDLSRGDGQLHLTLHWQVLQTLLPQHHIFVHLDQPDGGTLGQEDGPPLTDSGPAPSGSWLAGEYLSTQHTIRLPDMGSRELEDLILRVGLYRPEDNIRLPVTIDGQSGGDSVELATAP